MTDDRRVCGTQWDGVRCERPDGHPGPCLSGGGKYSRRVCRHGVELSHNGPQSGGIGYCHYCQNIADDPERAVSARPAGGAA